jgi:hypothetical protein
MTLIKVLSPGFAVKPLPCSGEKGKPVDRKNANLATRLIRGVEIL